MASVVFHVFSCLLGFIMIYPLLWLVASSFKSNDTMFKNTYSLLPESWGIIKNYNSGFASTTGYSFGHFFMNSAIVTVIGVVCTIFSFLLAAYAVSRVKFFGANFWFVCIIMTMMIPAQVMVVPQYIILKKLHLNDTLLAMILPWAFGGAFFVFLIVQYMRGIPKELDEAAMIDGLLQNRYPVQNSGARCSARYRFGGHLRVLLDLAGLLPAADFCRRPEELHHSSGTEHVHRP